ncbi:MAG: hypothetical protein HZB26_09960 [Candidatus Hydrogenedentes bacterium]|nr:hypothetical protein [Candidatus Hydrogenedentota bacterium]
MAQSGSFMSYVKAAFLWHWNLLAVGAGVGFALLSGIPGVLLPFVAAAEIAYLGLLSANEKFRKAIDAREHTATAPDAGQAALIGQIRAVLKPEAWQRFEFLRERCLTLNNLARQLRGPQADQSSAVSDLQTGSLERMLWLHLKLLYSQDALQRFLRETNRNDLLQRIAASEKEVGAAKAKDPEGKLAKSLDDKLQTLRQRLANYDQAEDNRQFLTAEIDRIEQKVNAISEMAINSRDAGDITAQVDGIAAGVSATEEAIRKMDVAPVFQREEAPKLLTQRN